MNEAISGADLIVAATPAVRVGQLIVEDERAKSAL
jgi:hypothetical protein